MKTTKFFVLFFKVGYALGIQEGMLPKIRGSMLFLYAASTAVLFYAVSTFKCLCNFVTHTSMPVK